METDFTKEQRYILAKKRVEKLSKFYKHLAVYLLVNIFLTTVFIVGDINDGDTFKEAVFNYHNYKVWFFWGLGILYQALNVLGVNLIFNKSWEERKIKEYMNQNKS
jgi:surface polysaccharide O-acyltransferase-like enzyme